MVGSFPIHFSKGLIAMSRLQRFRVCSLFGCLSLVLLGFRIPCAAQDPRAQERYSDIPKDSVSVFSLEFAKMRASKDFELWPWEVFDVAAKEQFGIDLSAIEAVDGMVLMPSPEPEFGISIRTNAPVDIAQLSSDLLTPVENSPKGDSMKFRDFADNPMMRVIQREGTRVLLGTQGALRQMTSSRLQPGGRLVGLVQSSPAMLKIGVNLVPLRDLISAFALSPDNQIPPNLIDDLERIIDTTEDVVLELFPDPETGMIFSVGTSGADKAELLDKSLSRIRRELLDLFSDAFMQDMEAGDVVSEPMKEAMAKYIARMRKAIDTESFLEVRGGRLVMKAEKSAMFNAQVTGTLVGMLLPAVQASREAARRMTSANNLKQIMLAMHNYHDTYKRFPSQAILDKDDKPLLSWRVAILPFLDQQQLYKEFHLDEPWDSPHNIKLLERMPELFRNPSNPPSPGITTYLVPVGDGVGLGSKGIKLNQIIDGTSNTLAVVDVNAELGVPWTKPDDFDINQIDPFDLFRLQGSNVGFFDGSVRFLSSSIDLELLEAMMSYGGGETIPYIP
jgi:prepilin-type processing-associated H-X9-DG protein